MEGRNEIENASRVWRECARAAGTRRFIRSLGLGRGCKVRVEAGSHRRPSRRCRIRGNSKTQKRQNRRMRESGEPEAASLAQLEKKIRGNPEIRCWHRRRMRDSGEPRLDGRDRRKVRDPRKLGNPSVGAEGERIQGNLEIRPSAKREDAGLGDARGLIARRHWRSGDSGRTGNSPLVPLKDARFEETRRSIAGTA